jgi:hypothetical protein
MLNLFSRRSRGVCDGVICSEIGCLQERLPPSAELDKKQEITNGIAEQKDRLFDRAFTEIF